MTRHFFLCVAAALICAVQLGGCTTGTCLNPQPEPPGACAPELASGEPGGTVLEPQIDASAGTGGATVIGAGGAKGTGGSAASGGSMGTGGAAGNAPAADASPDGISAPDAAADAEPDADGGD
jgi:hypothetical protein